MAKTPFDADLKNVLELSEKLNVPFLRLFQYKISKEMIDVIPERVARSYKVMPVAKFGPVLTLAMVNPLDILVLDELHSLVGLEMAPVISLASDILETIDIYYKGLTTIDAEALKSKKIEGVSVEEKFSLDEEMDIYKLTKVSAKEAVIDCVNNIIWDAMNFKASDIHIEPYQDNLRVRYRVDGMLQQCHTFSKDIQDALISRFKIMSKLDITQRKLPQDGRFTIKFEERDVDFRVSILPVYFGEKVVLRILDKGSMKLDLASLGFSEYASRAYYEAVHSPFGIILITGPTGSGKSTTLYSMLNELNTPAKNIVTIEDPIEYYLKGITQIPIKPDIGLTFAHCLRSVLRQSPDIIMVGEIRDVETVDIALKSALTGHLVLTTLHTNDAPSAITRLLDMGVDTFLIAGALRVISAQRLARKLCSRCKEAYTIDKENLKEFSSLIKEGQVTIYRPRGCSFCANSGYSGREAIAEVFLVDGVVKEMILKKTSLLEIRKYAESQGMKTLREDGFSKVLSGIISLEEVIRVTAEF